MSTATMASDTTQDSNTAVRGSQEQQTTSQVSAASRLQDTDTVYVQVKAKRGDVACLVSESSYTSFLKGTVRTTAYRLGFVTSVRRDGVAKAIDIGHGCTIKGPFTRCYVAPAERLDVQRLRETLSDASWPVYESLQTAQAVVRAHLRRNGARRRKQGS